MIDKTLNDSDVARFARLLSEVRNIVLTCHVRPDGDAIGSTLGLMHILRVLGKEVHVVTPDQAPRTLTFLPGYKEIVPATKYPDYAQRLVAEADLILCCDFNQYSRLGDIADLIANASARKVLIDHHTNPEGDFDMMFSKPDMSATCELAFRLIAALGLYSDMNLDAATCLLTGIVTDTRNFTVNCKHIDIYEILMHLLDKGADKVKIVKEALETKTLDCLKLQAYAISEKLEVYDKYHLAVMTLELPELERFHYERGDTEGLVNEPLQVPGIICSFFLREDVDCIKVSARSVDNYPVNRICTELYGGGGHVMAAGGEFYGTMADCKKKLIDWFATNGGKKHLDTN